MISWTRRREPWKEGPEGSMDRTRTRQAAIVGGGLEEDGGVCGRSKRLLEEGWRRTGESEQGRETGLEEDGEGGAERLLRRNRDHCPSVCVLSVGSERQKRTARPAFRRYFQDGHLVFMRSLSIRRDIFYYPSCPLHSY